MLKQLRYQVEIFITAGSRTTCNNGVQLDRPVIEQTINLLTVLPILAYLLATAIVIGDLVYSVRYWLKEIRIGIVAFLYIISLALEVDYGFI